MNVKMVFCFLILFLVIPLFAQPVGDECWLRVVITNADKLPVSLDTGMVPELYLLDGTPKRRDGAAQIVVKDGEINLIGLTIGKHEFFVTLGAYGFRFGPVEINITPGANIYEWQLPRMTQVEVEAMDGTNKVPVNNPLCYIIPKSSGGTLQTVGYGANGLAVFKGLTADTYQLMVIARDPDYYIYATVTVPENQAEPIRIKDTKVVKVNSSLVFTIAPPVIITVAYQLRIIVTGKFSGLSAQPYILTIRDKVERFPVPPGDYTWSVYAPTCKTLTDKITVVDGKTVKLDLKPVP